MFRSAMNPRLPQGDFYGELLRQHQTGGFTFSETQFPPASSLPRHSHESHYVCFVLHGTYKEIYDRKTRSCRPAMVLYHPAGELHAQYFDKTPVQLFRVEVTRARMRDVSSGDLNLECRDFRHGLPVGLAHKLYREFREPDALSYLAIEGLTLELIAALARDSQRRGNTSRQPPPWLSRAHELIKARFLEHLSLGDIAQTVGVHPVTLAREFRHHYGCTVGELVRRERIGSACRQLLESNLSLADVAITTGFCDQSHFARTFKRLTGITPAAYRVNYRLH